MHIIVLSKLYKGDPTIWARQIDELRAEKTSAMAVYAPLRNAIVAELETDKSGELTLNRQTSNWQETAALKAIVRNSKSALNLFIKDVKPKIRQMEESFLSRSYPTPAISLEDNHKKHKLTRVYKIEGRFHFSYRNNENQICYAYVHCSKWTNDRRESFIELLTIIAEKYYRCSRDRVSFIDLSGAKGLIKRPGQPKPVVQKRIMDTLRLLSQINELTAEVLYGETEE